MQQEIDRATPIKLDQFYLDFVYIIRGIIRVWAKLTLWA